VSDEFQQKIDEITNRYQPEVDRLEAEGGKLSNEAQDPNAVGAMINVDFNVDMKNRELSFNIPTVTMRNRKISMNLPEVGKNRKRIVFDVPTSEMERYCAFKVPHVHGPRIKMKCVYLHKPVFRMKRHEIIFDVPSVTMRRKEFILKVPEFGSKLHKIVIKLPEFTVTNIRAETKRLEERGNELRERAEALAKRMEAEVQALIATHFGSGSQEQIAARQEVENSYNGAIGEVEAAINELGAQKIDASKVPAEGGNINLRKVLTELVDERGRAVEQLENAVNDAEDRQELEDAA
jgi:hypothetical protein